MSSRFLDWLLGPVFDFAGERYRETQESIALGGASLAQELRGNATGARPTDYEITVFHEAGDDA